MQVSPPRCLLLHFYKEVSLKVKYLCTLFQSPIGEVPQLVDNNLTMALVLQCLWELKNTQTFWITIHMGDFPQGGEWCIKLAFLVLRQNFFSVICQWNFQFFCVSIDKYPGEVQFFLFLMLTCWTWVKQPRNFASNIFFWNLGCLWF